MFYINDPLLFFIMYIQQPTNNKAILGYGVYGSRRLYPGFKRGSKKREIARKK
jgi:hypothetical protein